MKCRFEVFTLTATQSPACMFGILSPSFPLSFFMQYGGFRNRDDRTENAFKTLKLIVRIALCLQFLGWLGYRARFHSDTDFLTWNLHGSLKNTFHNAIFAFLISFQDTKRGMEDVLALPEFAFPYMTVGYGYMTGKHIFQANEDRHFFKSGFNFVIVRPLIAF
jgi:hypothetical protein